MKLKFDFEFEMEFTEEQLNKYLGYLKETLPEVTVVHNNKFTEEFIEIMRSASSWTIQEDILLKCNY